MPQMGYDMTEGTIVRWTKNEGDEVKRGEIIAEIETDKATVEMEADATGVLRKILVREGVMVPVGQAIAYIGGADESIPDAPAPAAPPKETPPTSAQAGPLESKDETAVAEGGVARVSPVARRIADEQGIDIRQVSGTGPGSRITRDDVLNYAKQGAATGPPPAPAPDAPATGAPAEPARATAPGATGGRIELTRMGQAIARRTKQSKQEVPHFYVTVSIDMTRALEARKDLNFSLGEEAHVSVNDMIIKACALALEQYPAFNSIYKEDYLEVAPHVNIGIAIGLPEGLIVPAVLECERKSLVQIARETKDLGQRVRAGRLRQEEATAGTFSISNLGMYHVDSFAAIIVAPQSSVLATGATRPMPVVRDDAIVVRQMMEATLSADHRMTNGTDAARFINEVKRLLESPLLLVV